MADEGKVPLGAGMLKGMWDKGLEELRAMNAGQPVEAPVVKPSFDQVLDKAAEAPPVDPSRGMDR